MRHITQDETLLLREGIVSSLTQNGTLDEIEAGGLTFVFDGKVKSSYVKASTGVELLGMKETYAVTAITVDGLRLSGAYDVTGDEVATDLDPKELLVRRLHSRVLHHPGTQPADSAVQFVHCAVRLDAHVRLSYALAARQRGLAPVSCFRINSHNY